MCSSRYIALHGGFLHSRVEFTTVQEVPDRSTQMHSKYIPTYLTMVSVKEKYVFVPLYRPSRQASCTLEWSSPLHKKYAIEPLKCIQNTFLHPFVWLYRPLLQATHTPERSSSLHKNRGGVHPCTRSTR